MTSNAYTLEEVEQEIRSTYEWFHRENPEVKPQETGQLGALWSLFDLLIEEGNNG